jgi:hypothetical protein
MKVRPNIKGMFKALNQEHFNNEIPDIPVVWNKRMTTTAGYCRYRRASACVQVAYKGRRIEAYQIDLSDKLFRNEDYDYAKVERTLIHEMVHAFLVTKYNEKGHTRRFHQMMTDITGEHKNHRCHNYNTEGLRRKQKKEVMCVCQRCGYMYWKVRMPLRGRRYTHRGCGGIIDFTNMKGKLMPGEAPRDVKIFGKDNG